MKTIITAAIIAASALTATVSNSTSYSFCKDYSNMIKSVAEGRDVGLSAASVYQMAIDNDLGQELALSIIEVVFIKGEDFSPEALGSLAFDTCIGEAT